MHSIVFYILLQNTITKGSHPEKKSAYVWMFSKRPWPPPCIFGTLWGTFLKPCFSWTKVPQSVWILVILPHLPWKMCKSKQKKFPHYLWKISKHKQKCSSKSLELGNPPPFLKNVQTWTEQKSSSKPLDSDMTPPPPFGKIPNRSRFFPGWLSLVYIVLWAGA